jgi:metal-responsive CopG/Arc/MetJ family transcriptional regulator
MASMKTAISLDPPLLKRIDDAAAELRIARSRLLALAAEEFLRRYDSERLLAELNRAHAEGPTAEEVERRRAWKRQHRQRVEGQW